MAAATQQEVRSPRSTCGGTTVPGFAAFSLQMQRALRCNMVDAVHCRASPVAAERSGVSDAGLSPKAFIRLVGPTIGHSGLRDAEIGFRRSRTCSRLRPAKPRAARA